MTSNETIISLQANLREEKGKQVNKLRRANKLPAILYGHDIKNVELCLDYRDFEKVYKKAGGSSLVDLQVDKQKPVKVVIQDVQKDPVSDKYIHIDLRQVKMTEKISAEVVLKFVGESKAVKEAGGILIKNLDAIKIESLPQDLVAEIEIDISSLDTFDDIIRIKDLKLPTGIVVKEKSDEVVANVQPPRTEEELKSLEEAPEEKVEEVEAVREKEEEEGGEEKEGEEVAPEDKEKKDQEEKKK